MAIRDFMHGVVDVICDFFLAVWDTVVDLIKAAVRFVGRAIDFFGKLFKKTWSAIVAGGKELYIIFFGETSTMSDPKEDALKRQLEDTINTMRGNGNIPIANIGIAITMDPKTNTIGDSDEMKAFTVDPIITDPGMSNIIKERDSGINKGHAVRVVKVL